CRALTTLSRTWISPIYRKRRTLRLAMGTKLAFRAYPAAGGAVKGSVVLLHGSSASSSSMHLMGKGFAAAGYAAYTLDIRGHGKSGTKGHIAYIGQLEDDLEDFVHSTKL